MAKNITDKELLIKIIEKAKLKGYKTDNYIIDSLREYDIYQVRDLEIYGGEFDDAESISVRDIIFDHEFLKAFFGKKKHSFHSHSMQGRGDGDLCLCGEEEVGEWTSYCWQYHLQQMVLKREPLKYLEKFLNKD